MAETPCCVVAYNIRLYAAEKKAKKKIGPAIIKEVDIAPKIKLISPYKLRVKGPPKFIITRINQKKDKAGFMFSRPLLIIILRDLTMEVHVISFVGSLSLLSHTGRMGSKKKIERKKEK